MKKIKHDPDRLYILVPVSKTAFQITLRFTTKKVKSDKYIRAYLARYLDETKKAKRKPRDTESPATVPIRGVDYRSHQSQGLVTVHGYLRSAYHQIASVAPEQSSKVDLIRNLAKAFRLAAVQAATAFNAHASAAAIAIGKPDKYVPATAEGGDQIACKLVFNLSPSSSAAWKAAGIDVDVGLRHVVSQTMERYRLGVMDGAEIGYAIGIHHDKEHQHAHVILLLRSENGKRLKLANGLKASLPDGTVRRIDYLAVLINTANAVLRDYQNTLATPAPIVANPKDSSRDLNRLLCLAACDRNPENPGTELDRLHRAPAAETTAACQAAIQKRVALIKNLQLTAASEDGMAKLAEIERRERNDLNAFFQRECYIAALARRTKTAADKLAAANAAVRLSFSRSHLDLLQCATNRRFPIWLDRTHALLANKEGLEALLSLARLPSRAPHALYR